MIASLERAPQPDRRVEPGRHHVAHAACAHGYNRVARASDIRPAKENGGAKPEYARRQRRQLPIREVRGKEQTRLRTRFQSQEPLVDDVVDRNVEVARLRLSRIFHRHAVDVGEFGGDAAEIVPHAAENLLDLRG